MNKAVFEKILHQGVGDKNESGIPSTSQDPNTDNEVWKNGKRSQKRFGQRFLKKIFGLLLAGCSKTTLILPSFIGKAILPIAPVLLSK